MFYDGIDNSGFLAAEAPRCVMAICPGGYEVITTKGDLIECNIPEDNQGKPVVSVGARAFKGKGGLRHVSVPASVVRIGNEAFANCTALEAVSVEGAISEVTPLTFFNCASLTEIKLPASVKTLSRCAFASCTSLKSYILPDAVTSIGDEVFRDCVALEAVVLPTSLTSVGRFAFWGCNSLKIYYKGTPETWAKVRVAPGDDRLSAANIMYYSESEPADASSAWHFVDGAPTAWASTATVTPDAPAYSGILTAVGVGGRGDGMVSETVTSTIPGKGATAPSGGVSKYDGYCDQNFDMAYTEGGYIIEKFKGYAGTAVCVIPEDYRARPIVGIGKSAFEGCKSITNFVIPGSIVVIGPSAFRDCTGISSIALPDSVKMICEFAFAGCSSLLNVAFAGDGLTEVGRCAFSECKALVDIRLPVTVTAIGSGAFFACEALRNFTVPEGVTKVDEDTFKQCRALATVSLGKVTEIGYEAFMGTALTHVDLPDGVTLVSSSAFAGCESLKSIVLPKTLTEVGKAVFSGDEALDAVYYKGRSEEELDDHARFARGNDNLFDCTLYCYSDTRHEDGAFWRYVDGMPKPWVVVEREKPKAEGETDASDLSGILDKMGDREKSGSDKGFGAKSGFGKGSDDASRGFGKDKDGGSRFGSKFGGKRSGESDGGNKRFGGDDKKFGANDDGTRVVGGGHQTPEADPYAKFLDNFSFALRGKGYEVVRYQGTSMQCAIPEDHDGKPVCSIGQSAFFGAPVTRVSATDNITAIGDFAFSRCDKLTGVDSVESVLKIGEAAFEGCSSLADISITSTTELGAGAFKRCHSLASITISHQLTKVCADAFSMCDSLRRIYYIGLPKHFDQIEVADGNHAFLSAEVYYYSFDRPTTSGKAWHLVDGVPTPW